MSTAQSIHPQQPQSQQQARRILTTLRWVPEPFQGVVRDVRVRWALEEAGLSYEVTLIGPENQRTDEYLAQQPFGQVPVYQEGELTLFESGAILHHIAARSPALMPSDEAGRSRTLMWLIAAQNSVEPAVQALGELDFFASSDPSAAARRPALVERVKQRLGAVDRELATRDYLLEQFSVADILMATVMRMLRHTDLVAGFPSLHAWYERCDARPASRKSMADHMAVFAANAPSTQAAAQTEDELA